MKTPAITHIACAATSLPAFVGMAQAEEPFLSKLTNFVKDKAQEVVTETAQTTASDAAVPEAADPLTLYLYISAAVLVLVIILLVLILVIVKNKKKEPIRSLPGSVGDNNKTEIYQETPPPAPHGPRLRLVCAAQGVDCALRYSEIKDKGNCLVVGRDGSAWFALTVATVSRRHLEIYAKGGGFWVRDCKTTCGTTLNKAPLGETPMPLKNGDVLELAAQVCINVHIDA